MILRTLVSRGFLRPSHHYIPCRKEELLIGAAWGTVQIWREYSEAFRDRRREPDAFFLRFLGSRGRAEMATLDPADRLAGLQAEVWTVNPPAFGATSGPPSLERYADCALLAIDCLRKYASGRPIWVCGKSIGTAAALLAVANGGVSGAILRNAMPLVQLLERHYVRRTLGFSRYLVAPFIPARLDSIANARKSSAPAMFMVSTQDRVVPVPYQREIISAYRGPTTMLEVAGGHDERTLAASDEEAYRQAMQLFLAGQRPACGS